MAKTKRSWTRRSKVIVAVVCVVALALAAFFAYRGVSGSADAAVTYTTAPVEKMTVTSSIAGTGNAELSDTASVSPAVSGDVTGLSVAVGDTVEKGQVLFALDNPQLDVAVSDAQNAYDKAVLGVDQAKVSVLNAKKTLSDLYKRSHTSLQILSAKQDITSAELSVVTAENKVTSAALDLQDAKDNAAARTVSAPMSGVVTALSIENGDTIAASAGGAADSAPMTLTSLESFQVTTTLTESDIGGVKVGQKAVLTFDALPDLTLSGKVTRIDATGTNDQGVVSYKVVVTPDVMDPSVKGGMTVSASILTQIRADVLAVPNAAVKTSTSGSYVQILQNGGPVNVTVQVGIATDSYTEITSGVALGQEVITKTVDPNATTNTTAGGGGGFPGGGFPGGGLPGS
jgi:RND family efflux transporter MFP subunit